MARTNFLFYVDWLSVAQEIEDLTQRCLFFEAIINRGLYGIEPTDLPIEAKLAYTLISKQLERDADKYEEVRQKRAEAGKAGNAKRWGNGDKSQMVANVANAIRESQKSQMVANIADNENDDEKGLVICPKKAASAATLEQRRQQFQDELKPYVERYGADMMNNFFAYWSETNKMRTKMRFELERTWDVSRRLARWANYDNNGSK